jgi:hypothetical protein
MLHGEFAIDSGRKYIKEFERISNPLLDLEEPIANANEAYKVWNKFLAQKSLYPQIPKILRDGINEKVIDQYDIDEFLRGFKELVNNNLNIDTYITANYSFAKICKNKETSWEIFPSTNKVFILPEDCPMSCFDETLLKEIDKGAHVSAQNDYCLDRYFLKENGDDNIALIIKSI